jgi:hypothetical protein
MNVRAVSSIRRDHPRFIGPFPSPGWNLSARLHDVSGIRRTLPQHIDPRPRPVWNPSANFRSASKLRRARPRTITSRRSPAKPSNKRRSHFQAPKNPSMTCQLKIELRVEPSDERRACVRTPKRPSTGRRLAFQPRRTFRPASSELHPGSEEPFSNTSTSFPAPGGTFHRASNQRPDSEETFRRSSTRLPAPGGVHQRASKPPPGSEEPVSDSSTRIRTPGNSSELVKFMSRSRRTRQQTFRGLRASKEHFNERPICFRNPKKPLAKRCLASEDSESTLASFSISSRLRKVHQRTAHLPPSSQRAHMRMSGNFKVPKNLSDHHLFASELSMNWSINV